MLKVEKVSSFCDAMFLLFFFFMYIVLIFIKGLAQWLLGGGTKGGASAAFFHITPPRFILPVRGLYLDNLPDTSSLL